MRTFIYILVIINLVSCINESSSQLNCPNSEEQVRYQVIFKTTWNASSFPTNFPSGRHFSGLIGATHNEQVIFGEPGILASSGIERMAELGVKDSLMSEMQRAITSGKANMILSGDGISSSTDEVSLEFEICKSHSKVTLVSMLAPSPDWFVGVHNLELFDGESWEEDLIVELLVYDAGTDNGLRYTSPNDDTVPKESIKLLSSLAGDTDFQNGVHRNDSTRVVGTFNFNLLK